MSDVQIIGSAGSDDEPDEYCRNEECRQQLTRNGECLDGDGYDGLCGNCADVAEAEGAWGP